jgi:hypothetical protein
MATTTRAQTSYQRRSQFHEAAIAAQGTPQGRLEAALRWLRSEARFHSDQVNADLVTAIVAQVQRLYQATPPRPGNDTRGRIRQQQWHSEGLRAAATPAKRLAAAGDWLTAVSRKAGVDHPALVDAAAEWVKAQVTQLRAVDPNAAGDDAEAGQVGDAE